MRDHDVIGVFDALETTGDRVAILFYQNANTNTVTAVKPDGPYLLPVNTFQNR